MRRAIITALAGAAIAAATPADAQLVPTGTGTATVTAVNNDGANHGTITIDFDGEVGGNVIADMTSQLTLTFLGVDSTDHSWDFAYSLLNNGSVDSRTTGFAFDTVGTVNPTSGTAGTGSLFNKVNVQGNYPDGIGTVDVCLLKTNGASCSGGGNGGVDDGQVTNNTGTFSLFFSNPQPTSLSLNQFYVRYQSINTTGIRGGSGTGIPVGSVPEPATWAMMLVGFGGIGMAVRRGRKHKDRLLQIA